MYKDGKKIVIEKNETNSNGDPVITEKKRIPINKLTKRVDTVIIYTDNERKEIYNEDRLALINDVFDYFNNFEKNEKVGILYYFQTYTLSEYYGYIGDNNICNLISCCAEDKSNWIKPDNAIDLIIEKNKDIIRKTNLIVGKNGHGSETTKITIPVPFAKEIGFTLENKKALIYVKENKIIIEKK